MDIEKYIAELNPHELALRIAEAACHFKRPPGKEAEACMQELIAADEFTGRGCYRAALAAAKYLEESINNYQKVQ